MKNNIRNNLHILFDIDGTLTAYRQHALDRTFHGNFLFPVILDLAEDHGISRHEAERRILETERKIPYIPPQSPSLNVFQVSAFRFPLSATIPIKVAC